MEGFGVRGDRRDAERTDRDVPFAEMRSICNLIGRRDRSTWNIPLAFDALAEAVSAVLEVRRCRVTPPGERLP